MRTPTRIKGRAVRGQINGSITYPAPIGGWNARDAFAAMKPTEAIALENWFPNTSYVEMRGGMTEYATGLSTSVSTLAVYNAVDGANKMFAVTSAGVFNVSSPGAVGSSVAARTNAKHHCLNYGDGTNHYLMMFNGVDKPLYYDGTTWTAVDAASSPALTGLTTTSIIYAFAAKFRLFFIPIDSLSFWYLGAGVAGGALTEFPLDGVAQRGGYLLAGETWTFDAGDGVDDNTVFVTSEGEVIVYKGTDPNSGSTWALVGRYDIGRPIGRRCLIKYGGDLVVLCENGVYPIGAFLQAAVENKAKSALSDPINNAYSEAALQYQTVYGWEAKEYPAQNALLLNIPHVEGGEHEQFVMNTITRRWCKFTGWDAETFAVFNGELYFGTTGRVMKAWSGANDDGSNIVAYGKPAFTQLGHPGVKKQVKMFRPTLSVNGSLTFLTDVDFDFEDQDIIGLATYTTPSAASWDVSYWDMAYWVSGFEVVNKWASPRGDTGFWVTGKIKIATSSLTVQWMAQDYIFEVGDSL